MAPPPPHRHCSKSQSSFFKILHIISVLPPADDVTHITCNHEITENKVFDVDLNIRLRPLTEIEPFDSVTTGNDGDRNKIQSNATENSEISHVEPQSSGIDRDEGYLGLLFEAAQLILGEDSEPYIKPEVTVRGGVKRKQQQCWTASMEAEWYAEFEDTSPVVKSKRGRNQVLPYRYRDSVVEPLVWLPSSSHQLTGNATAILRSKRRSK